MFLFSSLTNKQKIEEMLSHNLLGWEELGEEKIAFETLYAYKITKTSLLRPAGRKAAAGCALFCGRKTGRNLYCQI